MLRYQKLNLKWVDDRDALRKNIEDKWKIKPIKDFREQGTRILRQILNKQINVMDCDKVLFVDADNCSKRYLFETIINEIKETITEPENYVADLLSCIYMRFGDYIEPNDYATSEKRFQIQIDSAWMRESNSEKINKEAVYKYYPVDVIYSDKVYKIGGGCGPFHQMMISTTNIGMFDLDSEILSLKRYSYMRAYNIYKNIKDTPIQNILLAEMSLGLGYSSFLYSHLRGINHNIQLSKILKAIEPCSKIDVFFIRKKILESVLNNMDISAYEGVEWDEICNYLGDLLEVVRKLVVEVFDKTLKNWWQLYIAYGKATDVEEIIEYIKYSWKEYYDDAIVYKDHIKHFRMHDWREIDDLTDCFYKIPDFTVEKTDDEETTQKKYDRSGLKNVALDCRGAIGTMLLQGRCIYLELPFNDIGKEILEIVEQRLSKIHLPEKNYELYEIFDQERERAYKAIRKEEEQFLNADVKRSKNMKCIHQYAEIHYKIMKDLLG